MRKKLKIEEEVKVNKTLNIVTLTNYALLGWEKPPTEKNPNPITIHPM